MKLKISPERTIGEVQKDFADYFPHLKLVFFSKSHKAYKGSPAKFLISEKETLLSTLLGDEPKSGELMFEANTPVWQLERLFEMEYGMHIQVFRRSGNTWLETSVTDDLTLEEQEVKGKESAHQNFEFIDPLDYREQD